MSWGYYSGKLTDYTTDPIPFTAKPDIFNRARASVIMIGLDGRSVFRLRVTGIRATGGTYGVHLHQNTCDAGNPGAAGPHYNVNWDSLNNKPAGEISKKTEVWLDLTVDSDGDARSTATVDFVPEGKRSIVLHADPTAEGTGGAGARLACLPFNIKVYGN